jgi:multidrug efflux pump subunit AcrB
MLIRLIQDGIDTQHAVIAAASARAKPIILEAPIFNGLAFSWIFGILASTVLTLVVIPVLYCATLYKKIQ